jgi:hypothetical protein
MDIEAPPYGFLKVTQLRKEKELFRASGNISQPTIVASSLAKNS